MIDEFESVLCEEGKYGVCALLQGALGEDQAVKRRGIVGRAGMPAHSFAPGLALHFIELILDLAAAALERPGERGVETAELAAQLVDGFLHARLGLPHGAAPRRRDQLR